MAAELTPKSFISEEIEVEFEVPPALVKRPGPPAEFTWRGTVYTVRETLSRWFDFQRRGTMAKNMQEAHLPVAAQRGSWGVGRFYFRVRTEDNRIFDLYYDRAAEHAADRAGHWFLWRELEPSN